MTTKSFLQRRSNLQGLTLRVMVERQPPFMMYPARLRDGEDSEWIVNPSGDQVKDITDEESHFYGLFLNSLRILEMEMNFITKFYIRRCIYMTFWVLHLVIAMHLFRDQEWGRILNGSWTGMIRTLLLKEADFIAASLTMNPMRFSVINYLHPIGTETPSMIIATDGSAIFSWQTYFEPFQSNVWYCLIINTMVLTICTWLLRSYYTQQNLESESLSHVILAMANDFWLICTTYFGGYGIHIQGKKMRALSALLLIVFIAHNAVFMSYRSSLTAELAVVRERLPFTTLEDLFGSDFR